jgi:hypothetical protein
MVDLVFVVGTIAFFWVAVAYTRGCEKLRGEADSND